MSTNPYESPAPIGRSLYEPSRLFPAVEGKALVVPSGSVLSQRCVKTNQPVSESDMVRKDFYWCSPWVALLFLISGCLVIIAYLLMRKKFTVTYGLSPDLRRKYRNWNVLKMLAFIGLFLALPFAVATESAPLALSAAGLFLVSIVALFIGNAPVAVVKYRDGMFWVKGCCDAYLADMAMQLQSATEYQFPAAPTGMPEWH